MLPNKELGSIVDELWDVIDTIGRCKNLASSIRTEHCLIYSVSNPHVCGASSAIKDFVFKDSLSSGYGHHVLELRVPFDYASYEADRSKLLSKLDGNYGNFLIKYPRRRDCFASCMRMLSIREIAYGDKMSIGFYKGLFRSNILEFVYEGDLETVLAEIYSAINFIVS